MMAIFMSYYYLYVCSASSLPGAITTAIGAFASGSLFWAASVMASACCKMGTRKASVLPLPVSAAITVFSPENGN